MKVLVFGSLNIDYVYKVEHFVQPGETIASDNLQLFCGGKGLNQSIAFAKSGVDTWQAGVVGMYDSDMLIDGLRKAGVHTELIQKKECPSGHAIIQKTPEGENSIILCGGANQMITKENVDAVLSHFQSGDFLVLQNEINQIPYIMEQAHQMGMKIVLNPAPMNEKVFDMPLHYIDYLIVNEIEGERMSGILGGNREAVLNKLANLFPDTQIVLTLGKDGSVYKYKEEQCFQPIYPVETVDTTAAGDTFTGFFMAGIIMGKRVEEALKIAAKASAIAVSRNGASASIPELREVYLEKL